MTRISLRNRKTKTRKRKRKKTAAVRVSTHRSPSQLTAMQRQSQMSQRASEARQSRRPRKKSTRSSTRSRQRQCRASPRSTPQPAITKKNTTKTIAPVLQRLPLRCARRSSSRGTTGAVPLPPSRARLARPAHNRYQGAHGDRSRPNTLTSGSTSACHLSPMLWTSSHTGQRLSRRRSSTWVCPRSRSRGRRHKPHNRSLRSSRTRGWTWT